MMFALADLPYEPTALEPYISAETLEIHHGKHHRAYVEKTNSLIHDFGLTADTLEQAIALGTGDIGKRALFNNAAQAWSHGFYWSSMTPAGGGAPHGEIAERIYADFGNYEEFVRQFSAAATGLFGSGWVWLALDNDRLVISPMSNADTPIAHCQIPVIVLDVWEHAYYLDHQNRRPEYVTAFLDHLVNWDFANEKLQRASDYMTVVDLFEKPTIPYVVF